MDFHYQLENEDNDMLFNVEGWVPDIDDIRYRELRFGTVDFDYWEEYEKQNEPTVEGTCEVEVGRAIDGDGESYEVERITIKSIFNDAGEPVSEELKRLVQDKLDNSVQDQLDMLTY